VSAIAAFRAQRAIGSVEQSAGTATRAAIRGDRRQEHGASDVICLKHTCQILTRVDKGVLQKTHTQWNFLPLSYSTEHSGTFRRSYSTVKTKLAAALAIGLMAAISTTAEADTAPTPDGPLTWNGITLYGTIDAGIQYQNSGAPQSDYFGPGTLELVNKASGPSETTVGGNYMSHSKIGIRGQEEFGNGWSAVFRVETDINPWSGQITDGLRSLTANNGKATTAQASAGDSSQAGQLFNGVAYAGISHAQFGTLTFGRTMGFLADGISKFDPLGGSYAFSPVGYSGTAPGGGDTEDKRLDSSAKYDLNAGFIHLGAQFQVKTGANPGTTQEFVVGGNFPGGSIDAFYAQKNDAIAVGSLSSAQLTSIQGACAGTATVGIACETDISKSLSGTISDNTTYGLMGKYTFPTNVATVYAGFEQIRYQNPSNQVLAGQTILGGYILAAVNTQSGASSSFPNAKQLTISWVGLKYSVTPKIDLIGAYYRYDQNNYGATGLKGWTPGCSSDASGDCSGTENFVSFVADYHFTKRFDTFAGAMWNQVQGGLANGFTLATSTVDPTIGFRYSF
jgi:predicted porin